MLDHTKERVVLFILIYFAFIDFGGQCCQTSLNNTYSRLSDNTMFQFSITPPSSLERYDILKATQLILRVDYKLGPSSTYQSTRGVTFTGDLTTGNLSFTLENVQQIDGGVYKLDLGAITLQCQTLYILGKPTTPTLVSNTEPVVGDTVNITCASTSTTVPSEHGSRMTYIWTVNGATNPTGSRYTYSTSRHTLTLSHVTKKDSSKVFRCTATEVVTGGMTSNTSNSYSINVLFGPATVTLNPSTVSYTENEGTSFFNIRCSADCNPDCTYRWTKQGQTTAAVSTTGTLSLGSLHRSEADTYTCTATNQQTTETQSVQIGITVKYAPNVTTYLSSTNLQEHSSIQLKCIAAGVPDTNTYTAITQTLRGTTIPHTRLPVSNTPVYSSLQFTDLQLQDTGIYTCHVNNGVMDLDGKLDQTAAVVITVKVSPKVMADNDKFAGAIQNSTNISIPFYSNPEITSMEFAKHNGKQIVTNEKYQVYCVPGDVTTVFYGTRIKLKGVIAHLEINHLLQEDFTNYTLTLTNNINTTVYTFDVSSEDIPLPPKVFRYTGNKDNIPSFYWEKDFNGGHEQYFRIETTVVGTDNWKEQKRINEFDNEYIQPNGSYIAYITGLAPGAYIARIRAGNIIGLAQSPANITVRFYIEKQGEPEETVHVEAIMGTIGSVLFITVIVIAVVLLYRRRTGQTKGKHKRDKESNDSHINNDALRDSDAEDITINPTYDSSGPSLQTNLIIKPSTTVAKYAIVKPKEPKGPLLMQDQRDVYAAVVKKNVVKDDVDVYENALTGAIHHQNEEVLKDKQQKTTNNTTGLVYADLSFKSDANGHGKVMIHGLDDLTEYVQVDFTKKAEPLPDDDEEDQNANTKKID